MAKSNPIGVRFDDKLLEKYAGLSPQKILNKLTEKELGKVQIQDLTKPTHFVKPITEKKPTTNYSINTSNIPPMPVKLPGENSFDYAERKNEWKRKYNTK